MKEKLMRISEYGGKVRLEEVKIIKETEKQFKIDHSMKNTLNKVDLGRYFEFIGIFCYQSEAEEIAKDFINKRIKRTKEIIESNTQTLSKLENSLEQLKGGVI